MGAGGLAEGQPGERVGPQRDMASLEEGLLALEGSWGQVPLLGAMTLCGATSLSANLQDNCATPANQKHPDLVRCAWVSCYCITVPGRRP